MPNKLLARMFGICKLLGMDIIGLRSELGLSQEGMANLLGLKSKGHLSQIENGNQTISVRVALQYERLSCGRINAASLNEDVALVRSAANDTATQAEAA